MIDQEFYGKIKTVSITFKDGEKTSVTRDSETSVIEVNPGQHWVDIILRDAQGKHRQFMFNKDLVESISIGRSHDE